MKYAKLLSILMVSSLLTACGGGGGGDSGGGGGGGGGGGNQAPTVSVDTPVEASANTEITITATASDPDGQIDSYAWEVTSSQSISLSGSDTRSVTFTTPDVNSAENVTLRVTVTDDDGATASANVRVNVTPGETATLTIQGNILDSADITSIAVLLDGEEISADTEMPSATTFNATIEVAESKFDSFVSIKGQGSDSNAHVALYSLLGTVNQLVEQAKGDATLTSDENFSVNLSSLTTAEYGLIKDVNGSSGVYSDVALEKGFSGLETIALQNWASAVIVANSNGDSAGELKLPDNVNNTLTLVESADAMNAYLEAIFYSSEFKTAKSDLLVNTSYFNGVGNLEAPFTLYFNPLDGLNYSVFPKQGLSHSMVFNADGTGYMNQYSFDWGIAAIGDVGDAALVAVFDDKGHTQSTDPDTGTVTKSGVSQVGLVLLDQPVEGRANYVVTTEYEQIVGSNDPEVTNVERVLVNASMVTTGMPELSETVFVPLPRNKFSQQFVLENTFTFGKATQYEEIQLNADGTGSALFTGADITWSQTDNELSITGLSYYNTGEDFYSAEDTISYQVVSARELHQVVSATVKKEGVSEDHKISTGTAVLDANETAWDAADAPGFYLGKFRAVSSRPLDSFFVELKANGEADVYYTTDRNEDGEIVETNDASTEVTHLYGTWEIKGDGSLHISTFTLAGLDPDPSCRAEDEATGCQIYEERTWRIIAESGADMMVTNKRFFNWTNRSALEPDKETNSLIELVKSDDAPVEITVIE